MKKAVPGHVADFPLRKGGYLNFQYHNQCPPANDPQYMMAEDEAEAMLTDANTWIQKYFPWISDFAVFQLSDGTVRLDASHQGFLG